MKTLTKQHGTLAVSRTGPAFEINHGASTGEWELLDGVLGYFLSSGYFDLAGMTLQEKTLFFKNAVVQDYLAPSIGTGVVGDTIVVIDLMTTSPLVSTPEIFDSYAVGFGFLGSHENFEQIGMLACLCMQNEFNVCTVIIAYTMYIYMGQET